jgi:carboxymethylenebutenolidase
VRTIRKPLQLHFAEEDGFFTSDKAKALEAKLREGDDPFESYWYKAGHAFFNQVGPNHNPKAATLAWERTTEFFAKHLK